MRTYEGLIEIDMAEFWTWAFSVSPDLNDEDPRYGTPFLDPDEQMLCIPRSRGSDETVDIDAVSFWGWVVREFAPNRSDEIAFGPVSVDGSTMSIPFAGGGTHPTTWATPPEWLRGRRVEI